MPGMLPGELVPPSLSLGRAFDQELLHSGPFFTSKPGNWISPSLFPFTEGPASPTGGPATGKPVQTGFSPKGARRKAFVGHSCLILSSHNWCQGRKPELVLSLPCGCGVTTVRAQFKTSSSVMFHLLILETRLPG